MGCFTSISVTGSQQPVTFYIQEDFALSSHVFDRSFQLTEPASTEEVPPAAKR